MAEPLVPKVSVSFITYNQHRYVAQAIESVLMQQTLFTYELVISDDCSTDGTREICRSYKDRFPDRIQLLERERNIGAVANYLETFKACRGLYVAFLEGDDFWIDAGKLQRQADFLDKNLDFVICCHNVRIVDENGKVSGNLLDGTKEITEVADLCRGDYIATASCMVRNGLLEEIPSWFYTLPGCDWPLDILNAEKGKIRYFPEVLAAYRIHPGGIWSGLSDVVKHHVALGLVATLNEKLNYKYDSSFEIFRLHLHVGLAGLAHEHLRQEHQRLQEEHQRLQEEHQRLQEEHQRSQEEHQRSQEEHQRSQEEHQRLREEHSLLRQQFDAISNAPPAEVPKSWITWLQRLFKRPSFS
jgi:glycosyltransferase involved in cell wall biosynthesis